MKGRRVLVVEDEPIVAEDIRESLEDFGFSVIGLAYNSAQALRVLDTQEVDIALLDITLDRPLEGVDLAHRINERHPIPFVFLTALSDQKTLEAVKATFPMGYLVKPFKPEDLYMALEVALTNYLRAGAAGKPALTRQRLNDNLLDPVSRREWEVLELLLSGKTNQEIADELFVSINTVKTHLSHLYHKLGVESRAQVLAHVNSLV